MKKLITVILVALVPFVTMAQKEVKKIRLQNQKLKVQSCALW